MSTTYGIALKFSLIAWINSGVKVSLRLRELATFSKGVDAS